MANPAELLFNQLTEWNNSQNSASHARKDSKDLALHRRAVHNLNDINLLVRQMESDGKRVGVYKRAFPNWAQIVFRYPGGWQGPGTGKIDTTELDHLENLIDALDPYVPKLQPASFGKVDDYLSDVLNLLEEDDSLDGLTRDSAREAVKNVRKAIADFEKYGDFRTEKLFQLLLGQLAYVMARSSKRDRWKNALDSFVIPYAVGQFPTLSQSGILEAITQSFAG